MSKITRPTTKKRKKTTKKTSRRVQLKIPTELPKAKRASSRPSPKTALQALGIHSVQSLDRFEPYRNARLLIASGRNDIPLSGLSSIVGEPYNKRPITEAPSWPIKSLRGLSAVHLSALEHVGIHSISDLADLGDYADGVLASGREDNGFSEPPSAPAELLPTITGSVSTTKQFSSFVKEIDIRGLGLGLDEDCIEPFPLSGNFATNQMASAIEGIIKTLGEPRTNEEKACLDKIRGLLPDSPRYHLGEIFTKTKCPVFYLGYLVEHHQDWVNLGTYLGDVQSSVCLAAGESRQIAFLDWNRRQKLNRQEDTQKEDQLTVDATHSRALEEVVHAVAIEHQMGGTETEANNSVLALSAVGSAALAGGLGMGLGGALVGGGIGTAVKPGLGTAIGAGVGGLLGGAIGAAGGAVYSSSQLLGTIHAASEGDRDVSATMNQHITQRTQQNSGLKQSLFSTVVLDDAQAEQVQATTRNITNYNHMHSLNVLYYEVLQHYLVRTHVTKIQPLLYLPYRFMDFTGFKFIRDYWDVIREFMDVDLQSQGDAYFADEDGPASPDLLPVPPLIVPPQAPEAPEPSEPPRIEKLVVDVFYDAKTITGTAVGVDLGLNIFKQGDEIHSNVKRLFLDNPATGEGHSFHARFEFIGNIDHAETITHMVISKNQTTVYSDLNFKIRVNRGEIKSGSNLLENLANRLVVRNQKIRALDNNGNPTNGDYLYPWVPIVVEEAAATPPVNPKYEGSISYRNTIIEENQKRQSAYDALIENLPRVKARLQNTIQRRRHFFTRVILSAMEPEQLKGVLDALNIFAEDDEKRKVPLHAIAHTQPIGMTAGAIVLKLKRFTPESTRRLVQLLRDQSGGTIDSSLYELLKYSRHALELEAESQEPENASTAHVYLPTGGLFAESVLGRANSAEYLDLERHFDWQASPIPHQPPAISDVGLDSRHQSTDIGPTESQTPLNVINAPNFPNPTGMHDVLTAIQNGNMFRDMSKAAELAGILKNLMSLSGNMGQAASTMTGQAAKNAMDSAVKMGELASKMTQKMFEETMTQAGNAFGKMLDKGVAFNAAKKNLPQGPELDNALKEILGITGGDGGTGNSDTPETEIVPWTMGGGDTDGTSTDAGTPGTPGNQGGTTNSNLPTTQLPSLPAPGKVAQVKPQDSEASKIFAQKTATLFQQSGMAGPTHDELIAVALEWYNDSVLPRLQQASNDDRFLTSALKEWTDWLGSISSLGIDSGNSGSAEMASAEDEARIWVDGGFRNAVLQAQQRAIEKNKIEYLGDAMDWSSQAELMGFANDINRLGVNQVIEDFPIQVILFDVQYPPEVALNEPTTFSAKAALKIADNDPLFKPLLFWKITVTGGSISGLNRSHTNSSGGLSTVINRTSANNFQITLEVIYEERAVPIKSTQHVYQPGLPT